MMASHRSSALSWPRGPFTQRFKFALDHPCGPPPPHPDWAWQGSLQLLDAGMGVIPALSARSGRYREHS